MARKKQEELRNHKFNTFHFAFALTLTLVIFLVGVIVGSLNNSYKVDVVEEVESNLYKKLLTIETEYLIETEFPECGRTSPATLIRELGDFEDKLIFLENRLGPYHETVVDLKKQHAILQTRHWLLKLKANRECPATNTSTILYFYNNQDCERCDDQGKVLTYVKKRYNETLIYSYDLGIDFAVTQSLRHRYNITQVPSMVVDEAVFAGFTPTDQVLANIRTLNISERK